VKRNSSLSRVTAYGLDDYR